MLISYESLFFQAGQELSQNRIKPKLYLLCWKFIGNQQGVLVLFSPCVQSCKIILKHFPVPKKLQRLTNKSCLRCRIHRGNRYRRSILRNQTFQKRQLFAQHFPDLVYWQISCIQGKISCQTYETKIFSLVNVFILTAEVMGEGNHFPPPT